MDGITEFTSILRNFENLFECQTVIHDYTGEIKKTVPCFRDFHFNRFCETAKALDPRVSLQCKNFDRVLPEQRLLEKAEPFYKYCHCGVLELIFPITLHSRFIGFLFIGPFRKSKDALPPGTVKSPVVMDVELPGERKKLSELTKEKASHLFSMASLLVHQLESLLEKRYGQKTDSLDRKELSSLFIARNFRRKDISLAKLAEALSLSESRTTQFLRANYRKTFPELVTERRLGYAEMLLKNSLFSASRIAEQSGFSDPSYFFRIFKKTHAVSPQQYRRKNAS